MKKLALIGCGQSGKTYADHLASKGILKVICDTDESKKRLADDLSCRFYNHADQLLQQETELDAVVIATPNGFHAEQAIKSLQARKDVIILTPACITVAAIWQMIETAKFCRRKIFIIHEPLDVPADLQNHKLEDLNGTSSFQLYYSDSTQVKTWRDEAFPGGSIYHTHLLQPILSLTELFGEVEAVRLDSDSSNHTVLLLDLQNASGSICFKEKKESNNWELTIRRSDRSWTFESSKPSLVNETYRSGQETEYGDYFPSHLQWKTALETVPFINSLEKLQKAADSTSTH